MTTTILRTRLLATAAVFVLLVASCGNDTSSDEAQDIVDELLEDPEPEPEPEPEADPEPEPDPEPEADLVIGDIGESFVGGVAEPYPAGPAVDGEVKVYFNNGTSGFIVAIFHGAGLSDPTGLCPGSSLNDGAGFNFISNGPASAGACDEFTTDRTQVRVCTGNVWLVQTKVPNDSLGTLYGSLEKLVDGTYFGSSAVATNSPGTPPINFDADGHTITAMFTSDGSTQITCAAPVA